MAKASNIKFTETILQGRFRFTKGQVVGFEDSKVSDYLDAAFNGTERSAGEPDFMVSKEELRIADGKEDPVPDHLIDPNTIQGTGREGREGNAGLAVMDAVVETK